jgi:hypothetical protein
VAVGPVGRLVGGGHPAMPAGVGVTARTMRATACRMSDTAVA